MHRALGASPVPGDRVRTKAVPCNPALRRRDPCHRKVPGTVPADGRHSRGAPDVDLNSCIVCLCPWILSQKWVRFAKNTGVSCRRSSQGSRWQRRSRRVRRLDATATAQERLRNRQATRQSRRETRRPPQIEHVFYYTKGDPDSQGEHGGCTARIGCARSWVSIQRPASTVSVCGLTL